jgi:hypothetical protein
VARPADNNAFQCSGRIVPASKVALIREVVATCRGLSRKELANTISELVRWTRANGLLKEAERLMLLTRLVCWPAQITGETGDATGGVGDLDSAHGRGRTGCAAERTSGNLCSHLP